MLEAERFPRAQHFQCPNKETLRPTGRGRLPYPEGKRNEKRLRLELVKKQLHSQDLGFEILVIFCGVGNDHVFAWIQTGL